MTTHTTDTRIRAFAFATPAAADQAIRELLAAGIAKEQLLVVCPTPLLAHFRSALPQTETPTATPEKEIVMGGIAGATLGGIALVATVLTGGAAAVTGAVLVGGGALAGGLSNLIVSKGYEHEADAYFKTAVDHGHIIVGVDGSDDDRRLQEASRILSEAGGRPADAV